MSTETTTHATDWEAAYLKLLHAGTAKSTRRAYQRDLAYFWVWAQANTRSLTPRYPVPVDLVIRFILEHNGEMDRSVEQRLLDQGFRTRPGRLKVKTLKRYLASLSVAHNEAGVSSPVHDEKVKLLLRRLQHSRGAERSQRKQAITADLLREMVAQCDENLRGCRDKALLLLGFAAGGRRRSELAELRVEDIQRVEGGYRLRVRRSKTDQRGDGHEVPLLGEAAGALSTWLIASGLRTGRLFRGITHDGRLTDGLSGRTINRIVKGYISRLGLDPGEYGAHSLRAGFITEAGRRGAFLGDAMALSGHRSMAIAQAYYREGELLDNPTAHLLVKRTHHTEIDEER